MEFDNYTSALINKSKNKIFLFKDDVWSNANTGFSSASIDIFEFYYKAIRSTFLNQFKDNEIQIIAKKILGVRAWESESSKLISNAANQRNLNIVINDYSNQEGFVQKETYWDNSLQKTVFLNENDCDPVIYSDFESFFLKANHGFDLTDGGKVICFRLWNCFIQKISIESMLKYLDCELTASKSWVNLELLFLKDYIFENIPMEFHAYISKRLDDVYDLDPDSIENKI